MGTLLTVTPTPQNTLFQCMAYVLYGDLNLAMSVKRECGNKDVMETLCRIYGIKVRVFGYNETLNRLEILSDHGEDRKSTPVILLALHLNQYYSLLLNEEIKQHIPLMADE